MKILINRNRIAVMQFERKIKEEQELYNEAVQILKGTGLLIDDPDVLTKLPLHYTKDLNLNAPMDKLLGLTDKENDYYGFKKIMDSLSFELDVYTTDGKQIYIEDTFFEYAETDEEIKEYKKLQKVAQLLEDLEIKRNDIKEILRPYVFGWNPYDQSEILIKKHHLVEGIQGRKDRERSRIHHIEQAKRIEAKKAMA